MGGIYQTTTFNVSQSWNISFSYWASANNLDGSWGLSDGFALALFTDLPDLALQAANCDGGKNSFAKKN